MPNSFKVTVLVLAIATICSNVAAQKKTTTIKAPPQRQQAKATPPPKTTTKSSKATTQARTLPLKNANSTVAVAQKPVKLSDTSCKQPVQPQIGPQTAATRQSLAALRRAQIRKAQGYYQFPDANDSNDVDSFVQADIQARREILGPSYTPPKKINKSQVILDAISDTQTYGGAAADTFAPAPSTKNGPKPKNH